MARLTDDAGPTGPVHWEEICTNSAGEGEQSPVHLCGATRWADADAAEIVFKGYDTEMEYTLMNPNPRIGDALARPCHRCPLSISVRLLAPARIGTQFAGSWPFSRVLYFSPSLSLTPCPSIVPGGAQIVAPAGLGLTVTPLGSPLRSPLNSTQSCVPRLSAVHTCVRAVAMQPHLLHVVLRAAVAACTCVTQPSPRLARPANATKGEPRS